MNNFIPMSHATALVMSSIGTATDEDRNLFNAWIRECIKSIGPTRNWIKECTLYPKELSFRKPSDMSSVIDISLYDSTGAELKYTYHPTANSRIHVDRFTVNNPTVQEAAVNRLDLSEDAYYFNLGTGGEVVTRAFIRYFAVPTDGAGELLIPDVYTMAIVYFCRHMWSLRKNDNRSEIDQNESMWLRERDRIRGKMKTPNGLEARAIAAAWMNLFGGQPLSSRF